MCGYLLMEWITNIFWTFYSFQPIYEAYNMSEYEAVYFMGDKQASNRFWLGISQNQESRHILPHARSLKSFQWTCFIAHSLR